MEQRNAALQKKLGSRPIVFQADGGDPLALEAGGGPGDGPAASSSASGAASGALALLVRRAERPLRELTRRLLRNDKTLVLFYVHILALYLVAACFFSGGGGSGISAADCVDLHLRDGVASAAAGASGAGSSGGGVGGGAG
eukprot:TRINITY_DN57139_c0_g1_i1.p2 TRINITY_DN57139_c0_g1~~TRINITY_DN57139_c0_g1_i1.p2  ORF type:complete len:148 (-),score=43.76 TRINITY_DN57139_c0_g1_i1:61-483(-)